MRSRIRFKSTDYSWEYDVIPPGGGTPFHVSAGAGTINNCLEEIWDVFPTPKRDSKNSIPPFNYVNHQRVDGTLFRAPSSWSESGYTGISGPKMFSPGMNASSASSFLPFPVPAFPPHVDDFPAFEFRSFVAAAHKSWEPVATEFSLANDLLEWRETKALFTDLSGRFRRIGEALDSSKSHWRRSSDGSVNAFLEYNFGIAPLIGDIQALAAAFYKIKTRLRFLLKTKGKMTTLRTSRVFDLPDDSFPVGWLGGPAWATPQGLGKNRRYKFTIGATLVHDLDGLDRASAYVKAFGAYAGFNKPLQIAWNAIPYSFLIDWSFGISEKLGSFSIPTFLGPYEISRYWWSCKASGVVEYYYAWPLGSTSTSFGHLLHSYSIEKYVRVLGPFVPPESPSSWSTLQKLLFAALAYPFVQRLGRYLPISGLTNDV